MNTVNFVSDFPLSTFFLCRYETPVHFFFSQLCTSARSSCKKQNKKKSRNAFTVLNKGKMKDK